MPSPFTVPKLDLRLFLGPLTAIPPGAAWMFPMFCARASGAAPSSTNAEITRKKLGATRYENRRGSAVRAVKKLNGLETGRSRRIFEIRTRMMRTARRDETTAQVPAHGLRGRGCEMFASPLLLALIIPNSQNRSCRLGRKANCKKLAVANSLDRQGKSHRGRLIARKHRSSVGRRYGNTDVTCDRRAIGRIGGDSVRGGRTHIAERGRAGGQRGGVCTIADDDQVAGAVGHATKSSRDLGSDGVGADALAAKHRRQTVIRPVD